MAMEMMIMMMMVGGLNGSDRHVPLGLAAACSHATCFNFGMHTSNSPSFQVSSLLATREISRQTSIRPRLECQRLRSAYAYRGGSACSHRGRLPRGLQCGKSISPSTADTLLPPSRLGASEGARCPDCYTPQRAGAKFCVDCGAPQLINRSASRSWHHASSVCHAVVVMRRSVCQAAARCRCGRQRTR